MRQGEFELARGIFGDRAFERNALYLGTGPQILQERRNVVEIAQAVDIVKMRPFPAGPRQCRQLDAAIAGSRRID